MIEHVVKKHVTLRAPAAVNIPESKEPRIPGDCHAFGVQETESRHEGDGPWRTEAPQEPGAFL